jgi:hypothetical protein
MIIVKIIGGLGNQMTQYAAGRNLSIINSTVLKLDTSAFEKYKLHSYSLDVFRLTENIATKAECDSIRFEKRSLPEILIRKILCKPRRTKKSYILEDNYKFDAGILSLKGDLYLDGYWGSEKYFSSIKDILMADFTLKNGMNQANADIYNKIRSVNSVSYHIRRGDYVSNPETKAFHGVDLKKYYTDAVELIRQKTVNPHFFIFSDEPKWVYENFKGEFEFTVVDCNTGRTGYEDMRLMSACNHNITANSSFSWWGAWLNPKPDKIVITPKKWWNAPSMNATDHIPESWISL